MSIPERAIKAMLEQPQNGIVVRTDLQDAMKSLPYSEFVQDFIAGTDASDPRYAEGQLENAYTVSVYLFSAMRKVANLASSLNLVAEIKKGNDWERLPADHHLNRIFSDFGSNGIYHAMMFYMLHGEVVMYKRKTRKALEQAINNGELLWRYLDSAIAGIHVIPNYNWELERGNDEIVTGLLLNQIDTSVQEGYSRTRWDRKEFVLFQDFSPSRADYPVGMATLAINDAITDSAISRWMAHYFTSGAMPALLVMPETEETDQDETELRKQKSLFERMWGGLFSRFSLRAVFTNRRYRVEQVGIDADKVTAPDLKAQTLKSIASVFQLAPDLIVPPEGGSQARHEVLVSQAYTNSILPILDQMCSQISQDFGFTGRNIRITVDRESIEALQAERGEKANSEIAIFQAGAQTLGELQRRLDLPVDERLENFMYTNDGLKSIESVIMLDKAVPDRLATVYSSAWDANVVTRNEYRAILGLNTPAKLPNGFKADLYPEGGFGGGDDEQPPTTPSPPQLPPKGGTDITGGVPPKDGDKETPNDLSHSVDKSGDETSQQALTPNPADTQSRVDGVSNTPAHLPNNTITDIPHQPSEIVYSDRQQVTYDVYLDLAHDDMLSTLIVSVASYWADYDVIFVSPDRLRVRLLSIEAPEGWGAEYVTLIPDYINTLVLRGIDVGHHEDDLSKLIMRIETEPIIEDLLSKLTTGVMALSNARIVEQPAPYVLIGVQGDDIATLPLIQTTVPIQPTRLVIEANNTAIGEVPVLTDWVSDKLRGAPEDGDYANRQRAINALASIGLNRERIQRGLIYWRTYGTKPDTVPPYVAREVRKVMQNGIDLHTAIGHAMQAVADGKFDADYQRERTIMPQRNVYQELEAWQKQALRRGIKSVKSSLERFETYLMPLAVDHFIREGLRASKSRAEAETVFSDAKGMIDELSEVESPSEDNFEEWANRMKELGGEFAELVPDEVPQSTDSTDTSEIIEEDTND